MILSKKSEVVQLVFAPVAVAGIWELDGQDKGKKVKGKKVARALRWGSSTHAPGKQISRQLCKPCLIYFHPVPATVVPLLRYKRGGPGQGRGRLFLLQTLKLKNELFSMYSLAHILPQKNIDKQDVGYYTSGWLVARTWETDISAKSTSVDENSESTNRESIWVEGLVPGIDFCNHNVKALATWEVDSEGNATGVPASMYLTLADKSSIETGAEIYINYGNKGNEELLYLYGFVLDNNPDDYLMVHYPVEALRQVQCSEVKMKLLEIQKGELRCLLPRSLLDNGFFGIHSDEENDNEKSTSPSFSWSSQRKIPPYLNKIIFPQEFLSTLRTIAMQEHELEQVASLLGEVGCSEDREPSDVDVRSAIWEVCGDHGSLGLLVDLLRVKMADLEEGTGTEASDSQLLETLYSGDLEESVRSDEDNNNKSKINCRSCIVYRRGQKQLARLFLREAEHLLELSANE